jgi:hypothetical protein
MINFHRGITVVLMIAVALCGCDAYRKFSATKIRDILDHPRDYEKKDVTVYGTVVDASSMIFVKFFELEDGTGRIKVVTTRVLPQTGEKLRVTGRMESIEIGPQRMIVLREYNPSEGESAGANAPPR